jgi:hypothetical protein
MVCVAAFQDSPFGKAGDTTGSHVRGAVPPDAVKVVGVYAWLTVPDGSDAGPEIVGGTGALMVMLKLCSSNCESLSVTRTVKLNEPVWDGEPEILPFEGLRLSPGGKSPTKLHVRAPLPPVAETI